jgi:hypothetical protein
MGRVFNARLSGACIGHAIVHITKQPNLKSKTWPKQLLGSLPLAFVLPGHSYASFTRKNQNRSDCTKLDRDIGIFLSLRPILRNQTDFGSFV